MELNECLFTRRSIRNFTKEPVSEETIREIINAAIFAPSACNFQAWKFILITDDTENNKVLRNPIALKAPYVLLVLYRNDLYVTGRVLHDYVQSAAAAIQNMLLYIHSIGLGGVWICGLPDVKVLKKAFGIPANFDIVGYVAFGHPLKGNENDRKAMEYHYGNEEAFREHKRRFSVDQVMCRDAFQVVDGDCTHTRYPSKIDLLRRRLGDKRREWRNKFKK